MSIREQMSSQMIHALPERHAGNRASLGLARIAYQKLKRQVHEIVLDRVELERLSRLPQPQQRLVMDMLDAALGQPGR